MNDKFPAEIRIGGTVPEALIDGLVEALYQDGASAEYGDAVIPERLPGLKINAYLDERVLRFRNDQAHIGEFETTEQFCMKHGIAFDRWSDHYCEYDAERVYFRPGMGVPVIRYADANGKEIVDGETVREALAKLHAAEPSLVLIDEAKRLLREACPEQPDELTKFEISS
jgi:hypothetical protein